MFLKNLLKTYFIFYPITRHAYKGLFNFKATNYTFNLTSFPRIFKCSLQDYTHSKLLKTKGLKYYWSDPGLVTVYQDDNLYAAGAVLHTHYNLRSSIPHYRQRWQSDRYSVRKMFVSLRSDSIIKLLFIEHERQDGFWGQWASFMPAVVYCF